MLDEIKEYLWRLINDPFFVIQIKNGEVKLRKGKLTTAFLSNCYDLCRDLDLRKGYICGLSTPDGIRLSFSSHIPETMRQRFRNIWASSVDNK